MMTLKSELIDIYFFKLVSKMLTSFKTEREDIWQNHVLVGIGPFDDKKSKNCILFWNFLKAENPREENVFKFSVKTNI